MSELITIRTPELIATEINIIKEQTRNMLLNNSVEIGKRLVEVKEQVGHGEWGQWLETNVDYSQSTAQNLMRVYDEYKDNPLMIGKLSYTQAVALLAIPEAEREEFVEKNNVEEMSTRELQKVIKERDEALKKATDAETHYSNVSESYKKLEQTNKKHYEKTQELEKQIGSLKKDLETAQATGDEKEIEALQESMKVLDDELAEAKRRNDELEKQLKEKPIEITSVIEKIPEEVEKELQELRSKVNQPSQAVNPITTKFAFQFEQLSKCFGDILTTLSQMDAETQEKYKKAIKGMVGKMSERV